MQFDDVNVGGQLKVGTGIVPAIKEGDTKINGSAFVEGPAVIGAPTVFPFAYALYLIHISEPTRLLSMGDGGEW